jgi:hypothetical protein
MPPLRTLHAIAICVGWSYHGPPYGYRRVRCFFVVLSSLYSSKDGGTGLGLSMAWGVMKRLGGDITTANRGEGGAIFSLIFPLGPSRNSGLPSITELLVGQYDTGRGGQDLAVLRLRGEGQDYGSAQGHQARCRSPLPAFCDKDGPKGEPQ